MKPSRSRVVKEVAAYRELIDNSPKAKHIPIKLNTLVEYCEALIGTETRIPVRFKGVER